MFCYSTPSDGLQMAAGRWIDAAVPRMPHRTAERLTAHSSRARHPPLSWAALLCVSSRLVADHGAEKITDSTSGRASLPNGNQESLRG